MLMFLSLAGLALFKYLTRSEINLGLQQRRNLEVTFSISVLKYMLLRNTGAFDYKEFMFATVVIESGYLLPSFIKNLMCYTINFHL